MAKKVPILFEDDDLMVVNKPAGILSIPDRYSPELPNLLDDLKRFHPSVFVVHRLDKGTSGLILFAKKAEAHKALNQQFEERSVNKKYWVLVEGQISPEEGKIDLPIAASSQPGKMIVHKKGKAALTTYKTIEVFRRFSLVEAEIHTGRTHQVRVHFQAIGFPLAVDEVYGKRGALFAFDIKQKGFKIGKDNSPRPLINRSSMHARKLSLLHPVSHQSLFFEAPLPKDLKATLNQLGKWDKK